MSKRKSGIYYDFSEDLKLYPRAWCYVVVGGRNTGKTYSGLKYYLERKMPIVYIKRTNKDVDILCSGNKLGEKAQQYEIDLSPYKSINRDLGTKIKAFKIDDGIGAFYNTTDEGEAFGTPVAYLLSLSAFYHYKGFDLSECPAIIFDEFIPKMGERVSKTEGEQLMDMYETVSRDRFIRNNDELKLICFANAVNVFNYTCETLEITDLIAEMSIRKQEVTYLEDRDIFVKILETPEEMLEAERKTGIHRAMAGTAWGRMAFGNEFAYNDFTAINKKALKGYKPMVQLSYKNKCFYIYLNESSGWYMSTSKCDAPVSYNLNTDAGQIAFYYDYAIDLRNALVEGRMKFEKYTMYDMILNYKKRFKT